MAFFLSTHSNDSYPHSLSRRQKPPLVVRQKKWSDGFPGIDTVADFVTRELLSNATDAMLRNSYAQNNDGFAASADGIEIEISAFDQSIFLKVTEKGAGTFRSRLLRKKPGCY
jgi:hypothetical protein